MDPVRDILPHRVVRRVFTERSLQTAPVQPFQLDDTRLRLVPVMFIWAEMSDRLQDLPYSAPMLGNLSCGTRWIVAAYPTASADQVRILSLLSTLVIV